MGKLVAPGTEHRLVTSLPFILVSHSLTLLEKCNVSNVFKTNGRSTPQKVLHCDSSTLHRKSITVHLPFGRKNFFLFYKGCLFVFVLWWKASRTINLGNPDNFRKRNCHYGFRVSEFNFLICLLFFKLECLSFLVTKLSHGKHMTSSWNILCWHPSGLPKDNVQWLNIVWCIMQHPEIEPAQH